MDSGFMCTSLMIKQALGFLEEQHALYPVDQVLSLLLLLIVN